MSVFGRSFEGICEFELKTFYLEKLEERFQSLRTFECHCVLLCTTLLRELSNLRGLAQVRAVKKSCFFFARARCLSAGLRS